MTLTRTRRRRAAVLTLALALSLGASGCNRGGEATLRGAVIEPLPSVAELSLTNAETGKPFAFKAPSDGVLLVYFGYTNCPDVCPTSLAHVKAALRRIGATKASHVSLALATVDPERDTADILTGYVRSFVDDATALRETDGAKLRKVADTFGVQYSVDKTATGEVEVSHTGTIYAVDDQGRLAVQWTFDADPEEAATIAHDLQVLLRRT